MDEFQVWNLHLDRTKAITAGWGSDQNKGKFILAALMKIVPSFPPQHLDSLLSQEKGVAAMAGTGCFFSCAVEWGFVALSSRCSLCYPTQGPCYAARLKPTEKPHWDSCIPKCLFPVPLCGCLDSWHPRCRLTRLMILCLLLCLKIIWPLFWLIRDKWFINVSWSAVWGLKF